VAGKGAAEKEAASRRATDAQVLEDAERLIAAWNERQALPAPMIFSPTIGAAIRAGYWFLWVRCPACRTINAIDLRTLDRHPDAAVSRHTPRRRWRQPALVATRPPLTIRPVSACPGTGKLALFLEPARSGDDAECAT
jgi:hypothetical protein